MYEEIRKYAIKLNETSPEHQIKIVELLEKVGEKVHKTARVRRGNGGDSSRYFRYYDGGDCDWRICSLLNNKAVIESVELIKKLEDYLHNPSTSHPDINNYGADEMFEELAEEAITSAPLSPEIPRYLDNRSKSIIETVETQQPLIEEIKINQKSEKTKMTIKKNLKETAAVTVGQNKEALIS